MMRALILEGPEKLAFGEVEDVTVGPDEILIERPVCGICGGDIKNFKGKSAQQGFPRTVSGHEFAGVVTAVGKNITAFREGDIVARPHIPYCGMCVNCRVGRHNFCLNSRRSRGGGFAEKVVVYAGEFACPVFKVPEGMSVLEAAVTEPITCALGGVLKAAPQAGERFVVIGLGGMGQFVAQALVSSGAYVIGIDMQKPKLEKAATYCHAVIDASQEDVIDSVMKLTGGVGADGVMEVVGIPATFRQALELGRMGARIVVVGAYTELVDGVNVDRIFRRDYTIVAAKGPSPLRTPDGTPLAYRYILDGLVRPKELITALPIERAQEAFERQIHGDIIKGVLVQEGSVV